MLVDIEYRGIVHTVGAAAQVEEDALSLLLWDSRDRPADSVLGGRRRLGGPFTGVYLLRLRWGFVGTAVSVGLWLLGNDSLEVVSIAGGIAPLGCDLEDTVLCPEGVNSVLVI